MLKKLLLSLMLCAGIANAAQVYAGSASVGASWNLGNLSEREYWGCRGYIVLEPNGLYQEGKGIIYHTHSNGSAWSPELIARYSSDGTSESDQCRLRLMLWRWLPAGRTWTNVLTGETGTGSAFNAPHIIICKNSNVIETPMLPYVTDLFVGVESKKVIYFESTSTFSLGAWHSIVSIRNNITGQMDVIWHYRWEGTIAENYSSVSNGHNGHAGRFELFNSSPYNSTFGKSGGNYQMDYFNYSRQWVPFNTTTNSLKTYDSLSGFTVYNSNPVPGFWLAKVP